MAGPGRYEPRSRARRRALQAVYLWHLNPQDIDDVLEQFREAQDFHNVDSDFFERLVRGVAKERDRLAEQLAGHLDRPWAQLDVMERVILQLGAWELLHEPETPYRVILDQAVDLAHRFGAEQGHSYVNGVLDKAARQWRRSEFRPQASPG